MAEKSGSGCTEKSISAGGVEVGVTCSHSGVCSVRVRHSQDSSLSPRQVKRVRPRKSELLTFEGHPLSLVFPTDDQSILAGNALAALLTCTAQHSEAVGARGDVSCTSHHGRADSQHARGYSGSVGTGLHHRSLHHL
ncbi:hypothetical protein C0Q70_19267 [Pomacea canaliculata]|uniref:Uncharacterized protein n=1 Tax=Pomacea canaliculata TaxID=400727 RepID=A0A2T7NIU5_POMCA|nr:hypothetical protein C0Q70_19267 [Pomacea canaliculata]